MAAMASRDGSRLAAHLADHAEKRHQADQETDDEGRNAERPLDLLLEGSDDADQRRGDADDGLEDVVEVEGAAWPLSVRMKKDGNSASRKARGGSTERATRLQDAAAAGEEVRPRRRRTKLIPDEIERKFTLAFIVPSFEPHFRMCAGPALVQCMCRLWSGVGDLGR
jgi:hypothetical protein